MALRAEALTEEAFLPYGQVIQGAAEGQAANQGTAKRRNWLGDLSNLRPEAKPNMCVFRVVPAPKIPFPMRLLERHLHSTQAFIPMASGSPLRGYLVIVCLNGKDDLPDLDTLKCFISSPKQGINYKPGCWHIHSTNHPIIALEHQTDFACLVWEDGTTEDCHEVYFDRQLKDKVPEGVLHVHVPGFE